jgi:hypothetical protein
MLLDTRNKDIYDLEVEISMVFKIFSFLPFLRGRVDPRGHI